MAATGRLACGGIGALAMRVPVLLALVLAHAAPARSQETFAGRLARADAIRSAEPARFEVLLAGLEADAGHATPAQRLSVEYLRAYQLTVYGDRPAEGARRAMTVFEQAGDADLKFQAGGLAVSGHAITRDFAEGLRILDRVMPLRRDVRDSGVRHAGVYAAAMLYHELGQYELALRYADEILDDAPEPRARCLAANVQLHARYRLDMLPADDGPLRRSIDQCLSIGEAMTANFIRVVLARKLAGEGRPGDALEVFRLHLPAIEAIGYQRLTVEAHSLMAELELAMRDFAAAERHARAALRSARSFTTGEPLVTAYRVLSEVAERSGNAVAALAAYRRYVEADMANMGDLRARQVAYEIVRDRTRAQARRIELLDQRNQLLRLRHEASRQAALETRLLAGVLVLLILAVGGWAWRTTRASATVGGA